MGIFSDIWDGIVDFFGGSSEPSASSSGTLLDTGMMDTGSSVASQGISDYDLGVGFDYDNLFKDEKDQGFLEGIEAFAKENPTTSKALMMGLAGLGQYWAESNLVDEQIEGRKDLLKLEAALNKATTGTAGSAGILRRKEGNTKRKSKDELRSTQVTNPQSLLE